MNREHISYEEFRDLIFTKMAEKIPEEFQEKFYVSHKYTEKKKFSDEALITSNEQEEQRIIVPTISIRQLYTQVRSTDIGVEELIDQKTDEYIAALWFGKGAQEIDSKVAERTEQTISDMNRPEMIAKHLFLSAVSYPMNMYYLEDYPYELKGNMAVVCRFMTENEDGKSCVTVNNATLEEWNMSATEALGLAAKNTNRLFPTEIEKTDAFTELGLDAYYITNDHGYFGAASIFTNENPLKTISEELHSDLIYLPLNVHEAVVFASDKEPDLDFWCEIAESIAYDGVLGDPKTEALTKEAYFYDRHRNMLRTPNGLWTDLVCGKTRSMNQMENKGKAPRKVSA